MALTGAERVKKYRERLKQKNPEKHEALRKKNLEQIKSKKKKISEMTEEEKNKQREEWSKQKRIQRQNKKKEKVKERKPDINYKELTSTLKSKIRYLVKKCNMLIRNCNKKEKELSAAKTANERLKKRCYRNAVNLNKSKARQEVLENAMSQAYKNCVKVAEKMVFKKIITNANKNKTHMASLLGLKGKPRFRSKKEKISYNEEITNFFLKDDVSRCTAGKKECRTKNKDKQQIRYLTDTLDNLYKKYKDEGGKSKFSTFHRHKPFYVISPHLTSRNTCLCIKQSNINFQFIVLQKNDVFKQKSVCDLLKTILCDVESYYCANGKCEKCQKTKLQYTISEENSNKQVTWQQWERIDHEYVKGNIVNKTKKMVKTIKTGTLNYLISLFENDFNVFKTHYFNVNHQQKQFQIAMRELQPNEALIICDFSENYETKMAEEVQSMHFGASKSQITLQTGMVYWKDQSQSFCTISPDNCHQPAAIWAHLKPVIKLIKEQRPGIDVLHFYSDGPTSQYRQKHNFVLLSIFQKQLRLKYATWSYFEAGHGKGVADGIGGSVKRTLDKHVCFGKDVTNATDAFEILNDVMKVVKIFYISENDIAEVASLIPSNVKPLKGTLQLHQIVTENTETNISKHVVKYRDVSCFCKRGLCICFGLKLHTLCDIQPTIIEATSIVQKESMSETLSISPLSIPTDAELEKVLDTINLNSISEVTFNEEDPDDNDVPIEINKTTETVTCHGNEGDIVSDENTIKGSRRKILDKISTKAPIHPKLPSCSSSSDCDLLNSDKTSNWKIKEASTSNDDYDYLAELNSAKYSNKTGKRAKIPAKRIQLLVKRTFKCDGCNSPLMSNQIAKCMSCKKWFCWGCNDGNTFADYICQICLDPPV